MRDPVQLRSGLPRLVQSGQHPRAHRHITDKGRATTSTQCVVSTEKIRVFKNLPTLTSFGSNLGPILASETGGG